MIDWVVIEEESFDTWGEREYSLSLVVEIGLGIGNRESKKGHRCWFGLVEKDFGATMHQDFSSYLSKMESSPFQFKQLPRSPIPSST